ncbi:MAG: zinc metallopeptidase [Cyclobacteriaceae bacterium]|nr:zinc metallopeptidase [Cyclobacteriaceae bacterium]
MAIIWIIFGVSSLISLLISNQLKSRFRKYSQTPLRSNLSGKEIAERMLADNGIHDVKVISTRGQLTDHYNPINKTVNLSEVVYNARNAAAAAVAAHECGHAVQHATAYRWLTMRSRLVPVVSSTSRWIHLVLLAGIVLVQSFPYLLLFGILIFACTTLFSFITLPVEYDASNRALAWIDQNGIVTSQEHSMAKDALKWAARTYVVAALASLATLLYYVSIFLRRR